jgi:hypothetical protein
VKVAVEQSQLVVKTHIVEVPDETPDSGLVDAIAKAGSEAWHYDPDLDANDGPPTTDAIYRLDEDGDPVDEPSWVCTSVPRCSTIMSAAPKGKGQ